MKLLEFFRKNRQNNDIEKRVTGKTDTNSAQGVQSDINVTNPPYIVSETGKARYIFEHQILREQFYSNTRQFINAILQKGTLFELSCIAAEHGHYDNPYCQTDFNVDAMRWNSDISLVSIELPIPKFTPLCYRIHMLFSDDYTNLGYYTIECGMDNNAFLCGWSSEGHHVNYHEIATPFWLDQEKGIHKAIEAKVLIDIHAKNFGLKTEHIVNDSNFCTHKF